MQNTRKLWTWLAVVMFVSFGVLGLLGREIYRNAPPIPAQVVAESGTVLFTADDIQTGRAVCQSAGGMQLGSIWGHGTYLAPDWSADWLHRESVALLDRWSRDEGAAGFSELALERQAVLQARLLVLAPPGPFEPRHRLQLAGVDRTLQPASSAIKG